MLNKITYNPNGFKNTYNPKGYKTHIVSFNNFNKNLKIYKLMRLK